MVDLPPYPGAPRWVKVYGIIIGVVVVLFVIVVHAGGGPNHNIPFGGGMGGQAASAGGR